MVAGLPAERGYMEQTLAGKISIVTAAGQGIGFGTPEEIAEMVCYLAGDLSAFTTGQAFAVDGGWSI